MKLIVCLDDGDGMLFNNRRQSRDKAVCEALYKETVKTIDQAVVKGILKKNTAARKKSQITLKYNAL